MEFSAKMDGMSQSVNFGTSDVRAASGMVCQESTGCRRPPHITPRPAGTDGSILAASTRHRPSY